MVKGVNKTVIEINDTGSKFFDKVVFYVSPKYSFTSENRLKRAAGNYFFSVTESKAFKKPLRKRVKNRQYMKIGIVATLLLAAVVFAIIKFL
ncbi:MAG: hypothetical protein MJ091_05120 [Clostridia bacterium]|nr:hypothetical protein [Clostridia bacterium]